MITCTFNATSLQVSYDDLLIINHDSGHPFLQMGTGITDIDMYRGNYFFEEKTLDLKPLDAYSLGKSLVEGILHYDIKFWNSEDKRTVTCKLHESGGRLVMRLHSPQLDMNRFVLSIDASSDERIYGCGEQFTYLNLRGNHFPLWTQEQGVGRNKQTAITQIADREDRAGGDYHTTFYPQTTFVSTRGYYLHAYSDAYADFDFSHERQHNLMFWQLPEQMIIGKKPTLMETVGDISALLGRQPSLPDWCYDGMILGIQGGTDTCRKKLAVMREAGAKINGIWAQDWEGEKHTSFGKRLRWNWQWDASLYPGLDTAIQEFSDQGVKFLGYINPYVLENLPLFEEAKAQGFLALNQDGEVYLVDFGEFDAGIVDFSNTAACNWYASVIDREMIQFGLAGWMADFGEYLPTDCVLHDGSDPMLAHNRWPGLWAQVNKDSIVKAGKQDEILYFMRAGNAMSLSSCPMMWAGDQNVDWSEDDGLLSAITGALSLSMSGMGLSHSDIGGYTTLYGMARTKQLLMRWCEFSTFTALMRSHEGNRPASNWQFDSDEETISHIARMTRIHVALKPYIKQQVKFNSEKGIPLMRPMFLQFDEPQLYDCKDQYMFGDDLLVCPMVKDENSRSVFLPKGRWIHLFTNERYDGGYHMVDVPLGYPAVFYQVDTQWKELFEAIFNEFHA